MNQMASKTKVFVNTPLTIITRIYGFFIDGEECLICGRPDAFDCNENELCGRADRAIHGKGEEGVCAVLRAIIASGVLNDTKGDETGGHLLADARAVLRKPLLVPLRRKNLGIKDDPQYSPYFPSEKYGVFEDYNHPDGHLAYKGFRNKREAKAYCDSKNILNEAKEPERKEVICPKTRRCKGDVVGCGSTNVRWNKSEGVYDCLNCGIWFLPKSAGRRRRK